MIPRAGVVALVAALGAAGCGVALDVAYLAGGGRSSRTEDVRRATGQVETRIEATAALGPDGRLRLACAQRTRSIDRVWSVTKVYQARGGYHQAHWLPIVLEGVIGGGIAIGVTAKCTQDDPDFDCTPLYYLIPLAADVAYSGIRLLMIDPPKLVDKRESEAGQSLSPIPLADAPVACPAGPLLAASGTDDPQPVLLTLEPDGALAADDEPTAAVALVEQPRRLFLGGVEVAFDRCPFLTRRAHLVGPDLARTIAAECPIVLAPTTR